MKERVEKKSRRRRARARARGRASMRVEARAAITSLGGRSRDSTPVICGTRR